MIRVCPLAELPPGEATRVVAHVPVAVFNADGELFAIDDTCTHQDASLSEGWLEGCLIECPLHEASFDLRTYELRPICLEWTFEPFSLLASVDKRLITRKIAIILLAGTQRGRAGRCRGRRPPLDDRFRGSF